MLAKDGRLIYVFGRPRVGDSWLDDFRDLMMGPVGWDPEDWDEEMAATDDGEGASGPSLFCQLITVYRYQGMTPVAALRTLLEHPDFEYLVEAMDMEQLEDV